MARILMFNSAANAVRAREPAQFVGYSTAEATPKYTKGVRVFSGDGEERVFGLEMMLNLNAAATHTLSFYMLHWGDYAALGWPPPRPDFGAGGGVGGAEPGAYPQPRFPSRIANKRWMREVIESAAADGTVTHAPVTRTLTFGAADGTYVDKVRFYLPLAIHTRWVAMAHWWDVAPTDPFYVFGHVGGHSEVEYVESREFMANGYPYEYEANKQSEDAELPVEI